MTDRSVRCDTVAAMSYLQTSTGPIAYDERGEGLPIVMLPSGAHDRHDYDELRSLLGERYRSISLDWPGHGESPAGEGAATAMRFADIAEQLVEQLAPTGAVVLGNSVGGFAAARLAIRRPELVRGLVLLDSGGFAGRPLQVRAFCALMSRPWFLRRIYPAFSALYMRSRTPADRRAREVGVATTSCDPGLRAVTQLWRSFSSPEHDLRDAAGSILAPTLLIWGRRDPVIPVRIGRRLAARIPGSELVVLDTGHVPHTSDTEAVAARLIAFAEAAQGEVAIDWAAGR
jgi:pimeloyl-ACP methyl ester carboxylesterase